MRFTETRLAGVYLIGLESNRDTRGFFARTYCDDEFALHNLNTAWPQENISYNRAAYTLRGMHLNRPAYAEVKTVRCIVGAIYDVVVDLRADSATQYAWFGVELTAEDRKMLYVPRGLAHGYLSLTANAEVQYRMGSSYQPDAAIGFRWNDPFIGIAWPEQPVVISDRDRSYPDIADRLEEYS